MTHKFNKKKAEFSLHKLTRKCSWLLVYISTFVLKNNKNKQKKQTNKKNIYKPKTIQKLIKT